MGIGSGDLLNTMMQEEKIHAERYLAKLTEKMKARNVRLTDSWNIIIVGLDILLRLQSVCSKASLHLSSISDIAFTYVIYTYIRCMFSIMYNRVVWVRILLWDIPVMGYSCYGIFLLWDIPVMGYSCYGLFLLYYF